MSIALALIAAGMAVSGAMLLSKTFLAFAFAGPFITLLWLARRAHYALLAPQWPLLVGALYLVVIVAGCYVLARAAMLSSPVAVAILGAGSAICSLPLIILIRPRAWGFDRTLAPSATLARHWHFGKWSSLTSTLRWSSNYAYYLLLPLYVGLQASALLRAHLNLLMPILHANSALYGILIPQLSKIAAHGRWDAFRRFIGTVLVLYALGALVCWVLGIVCADPLFALLYNGQYQADRWLVALIGLVPLASGIAGVLESALLALSRPRLAAMSYIASAAVTLTIGWGLLAHAGVLGAGLGLLFAWIAAAATMVWLFVRWAPTALALEAS
jgi:O-antigen/teichoic acid export membrane protein